MSSTILISSMVMTTTAVSAKTAKEPNYTYCNVNGFGGIDIDDVTTLYDYLAGSYTPYGSNRNNFIKAADIDKNGVVDDADLTELIDAYIYRAQNKMDVDGNGVVNIIDATAIQVLIAGQNKDLTAKKYLASDINKDGVVNVIDATVLNQLLLGCNNVLEPTKVSQEVKNNDVKYRKAYSKYLTSDVLAAMKGCYLIKNDEFVLEKKEVYFRDSTWLYRYVAARGRSDSGLRVIGTYDLNNKDIVFPSKTDGGVIVDGVGYGSSRSKGMYLGSSKIFEKNALGFNFADTGKSDYYGFALNSIFVPSNYDIEGDALKLNLTLQYVFLSDNVTLHERCFYGDSNLKQIKLPDTITKIPISVVSGCESLTYVKIPDSVKEIDTSAFSRTGLSKIIFGKNVEVIKDSSFQNTPLKEVYVYNPTMTIGPAAFYNDNMITNGYINPNCTFYGYKPSTLLEWLQEKKADFDEFEGPMVYKFALIK